MFGTSSFPARVIDSPCACRGLRYRKRMTTTNDKAAVLYRMVMDQHLCPYGLKARHLLVRQGYAVEDHHLASKEEVAAFKSEHGVETTPQVWIGGERIGGYDQLREHLGEVDASTDEVSYQPVLALFAVAMLLSLAVHQASGSVLAWSVLPVFAAISMALLALQKLGDVEGFSLSFLNYDLLAQRWVPYAKLYPFAELAAAVLMLAGGLPWVAGPLALFVGSVGAVSVFKAVYVDRRELKCACVGGNSKVPLGFVSLTENLIMIAMGAWTLGRSSLA